MASILKHTSSITRVKLFGLLVCSPHHGFMHALTTCFARYVPIQIVYAPKCENEMTQIQLLILVLSEHSKSYKTTT